MAERLEETTLGCSWIPTTPAKPGVAKEQLTCSNRDKNQPVRAGSQDIQREKSINHVMQLNLPESLYQDVSAYSSNPVNVSGGCNPVIGSGTAESRVYSEVLSSFDTWQASNVDLWANMSFSDLLAMADANANRDVRCGGKFTGPNMDNLQARRLDSVTNVANTVWGGTSCGDNLLRRTCTSSFEPMTPEKNRKVDQMQDSAATHEFSLNNGHTLKEAEHIMITRGKITEHNEMNERSHLVSATKPTELQENHELDKEGAGEADLGKTPQQKPRRRKHRPKVIREGKTKNSHTPSPEKPLAAQENIRVKRKYVRKKGILNSTNSLSEAGAVEGSIANDTPVSKRKCTGSKAINKPGNMNARSSCKRSLNFDLESQIGEESSVYGSSSKCNIESRAESCSEDQSRTVEYTESREVIMEKNDTGIANGMTNSRHQGVDYLSNADQSQNDFLPHDQSVSAKGKCKIVFSDITNDKEANTHVKWTANVSMGTSSFLITEKQSLSLQSQHVDITTKTQQYGKDDTEAASNLQDSNVNIGKGSESFVQLSPSSKSQGYSPLQCQASIMPVANQDCVKSGQQVFEELMALGPRKRIRKRNSKSPTQVQDLNSKLPMPAKKSKPGKKNGQYTHEQVSEANTSPVVTKLSPNNSLPMKVQNGYNQHEFPTSSNGRSLAITWECISTVDSIVQLLDQLSLNAEISQNRSANSADHIHYQTQCPIVPYQTGGAVVPFDVSFGNAKRKQPRPKVELDDETNRVWQLLLENINSEGIDGTDEEKTKWWDEERRVFKGRADSFIARMHLVQGDRRFSPWKGSVVDSVVGVFLTQNVSDHLSSSAFMSLAARFPLEAKTIPAELHEARVSTKINETEVCVLDSEDTFGSSKKSLLDPVHLNDAKLDHDTEDGDVNSFDDGIRNEGYRDTSECSPIISHVSDCNKLTSLNGDGYDMDETVSSQASVISTHNSADSLIHQTTESEEPSSSVGPNRFASSISFVELLKMAGTVVHDVYENCNDKYDENQNVKSESSPINSQQSGLSVESVSQATMKFTFVSSRESTDNDKMGQLQPPGHFPGNICNTDLPDTSICQQNLMEGSNSNDVTRKSEHDEVHSKNGAVYYPGETVNGPKPKGGKKGKEQSTADWDGLRKEALKGGGKKERTVNTMDSVDWEAVRSADVGEIADAVKERGMNNKLAERIQAFLDRIVRDHGSIDLEWLRDVPPDKAKEYLLSVRGLGLKSVECIRLLTLHQLAFPVDTNVGRIAVRLGWVPLQPLPESLQLHLLELYPIMESIQKYLWPRLCKLDQRTLYELHYQLITFGKVFCTKSKPNCNACPMRGECRHFASAFASARLALPAPEDKSIVAAAEDKPCQSPNIAMNHALQLPSPQTNRMAVTSGISNSQPIIEEPRTPEPIIEMPATPEQSPECDIEDMLYEDPDDIPTIHLNMEQFTQNLHKVMEQNTDLQTGNLSSALVALTAAAASIPVPKLKNVSRLRTEHQVYELPDSHPLLQRVERREPDDPSPYLLAIWTPGETIDSIEPPEKRCSSQETGKLCTDETCSSCSSIREQNSQTVRGTLLIPCRTAMRGSFPLNGTYFQVNEVFSDNDSSLTPIDVPREWLWNLPRRVVYFGTSIPTIFKGLTTEQIQYCFWRGFVCVRGFDRSTRSPRPLIARLHFPASKMAKRKGPAAEN